jgi:hypothetical protein
VHPGGDPSQIKLKTEWVEELKSNADGSLTLNNRMGSVTEQRPVSFQDGKDVKTNFAITQNTISFHLENFDKSKDIVIDPGLVWGTYYGGNEDEEDGASCATDISENVYISGNSKSTSFIASGGHQSNLFGSRDAFLVKFNSAGVRQWATYYGGSSLDYGTSCTTDENGNVYLAGRTYSNYNISSSGHQDNLGGVRDAFLVKFNSAGIRQWATYYGGSEEEHANNCSTDKSGNVYLAGSTSSNNNIASGGHQNTYGDGIESFLVKFNSDGVRQWATYYGGRDKNQKDFELYIGGICATDKSGNVYLAGSTTSNINIASGGHQNTYGGDYDAFLVKFNSAGVRQWATYYGGSAEDNGYNCATDGTGNVYLAGRTFSSNNIASGGHQNTHVDSANAFLVKFNSSGVRQWATYYGGVNYGGSDNNYSGGICATDGSGNVYLAGSTTSTTNIASGGHQNTYGGDYDAFLVKFNRLGIRQWATYCGGSGFDMARYCTTDGSGNVYLTGFTYSYSNIALGGHRNTLEGQDDAFLAKFSNSTNSSISEKKPNNNFNIYPNPSEKLLNIETNEPDEWNAVITDSKGAQIKQIQFQKSTQLDINNYAPGVYYIQLTSKEEVLNYKFIKK